MSFQSTVFINQGLGVAGDLFTNGPRKAESFRLVSADAAYNVFGRAFTVTSEGLAAAGGTGVFAGILSNPKGSALLGTSVGGTLAPSLVLPNNAQGELMTMGSLIVALPAAAAIGDLVIYNTTTGELATIAPGADLPANRAFAQAYVDYFTVADAGLAVITLSPTLITPVPA